MDVGKEVPNHYKSEFEFSTFISFLYLFLCIYCCVEKVFEKPNSPPPPFWVFSLIIHSLCFITLQPLKNDEDLRNMFQFSDRCACVYICLASTVEDDETIENEIQG